MGKAVVPKPYYISELPGNSSMQIPSVPFSKTIKLSRGGARNLEFNRFPMPLTCGVVFRATGVGKRVLAVPVMSTLHTKRETSFIRHRVPLCLDLHLW